MATTSKKLVIVESPAKAKTIEKFLGRGYAVRASLGHVRDLPKRRLGVNVEQEFEPTYVVPKEKKDVVKELAQQVRGASELLLATDPDREGEAIAWHLTQAVQQKGKPPIKARRIVFHEITKSAIQEALKHPREIDSNLVRAQQARRVIDRLVGYKLSPLLWNKVKKGLSAGRVQSVAVRLVVEREREVAAFKPEGYWTVEALLRKLEGTASAAPAPRDGQRRRDELTASLLERNGERLELKDEASATAAVNALRQASYSVADVRQREVSRSPAPPFITSTMQQEAGRRLGFTAKRTMNVAQQLYEGLEVPGEGQVGLITYMRTDSPQVAREAQDQVRQLIGERFGAEFVPNEPRVYKSRSKGAQEAHEAIRPTSAARTPEALRGHITTDQYRLYALIWKRFVASQMENAVFDTTTVDVRAAAPAGDTYLLRASGSVMRFAGFLKVMGEADEDDDSRKKLLPDVAKEEPLALESVTPEQHFTQPPPRFTEATLIKAMEEEGIGRPSTYAPIITTIQDRGYVEKQERALRPTELGMIVNDLLVEHFPNVVDPGFTAQIEEHLDQVADGETDWVPVVREFYDPFAKTLEQAASLVERVEIADEPSDEVCDCTGTCGDACAEGLTSRGETVCGRQMVIKLGRFGKFLACSGFPECRTTRTLVSRIGVSCPKCSGDLIEKKTRKGRTFYGCINFPTCDFASWQRPVPQRCDVEGGLQVLQAGGKIACTVCGKVTERAEEPVEPVDDSDDDEESAGAVETERERERVPVTV